MVEHGGFLYDADSYADDLPYWVDQTRKARSRTWSCPTRSTANDMRFATPQGFNSGEQFFAYLKDSFDVLYAEGERAPKMMSVGLHCRLVGRPGRAAALARFLDYVQRPRARVDVPARRHRAALDAAPIPGEGDRHALRTGDHAAGASELAAFTRRSAAR